MGALPEILGVQLARSISWRNGLSEGGNRLYFNNNSSSFNDNQYWRAGKKKITIFS
jgi:hypothetical protein